MKGPLASQNDNQVITQKYNVRTEQKSHFDAQYFNFNTSSKQIRGIRVARHSGNITHLCSADSTCFLNALNSLSCT